MKHQRPDAHAHTEPADTIPSGRRKLRRAAPQPLRLEPRLMFDGAALATTAEVVHEPQPALDTHVANANEMPIIPPAVESPSSQAREVLYIAPTVADWQTLAGGVRSDVETVVLGPRGGGRGRGARGRAARGGRGAGRRGGRGSGGD